MKVLSLVPLVSDEGAFGGPVTVAVNQARELRTRGHEVTLAGGWSGRGGPPSELAGVPALLRPVWTAVPRSGFVGLVSPPLWSRIRRDMPRFDIAHLHTGRHLLTLVPGLMIRRRVPFVTQTHGMVMPTPGLQADAFDRLFTRPVLLRAAVNYVLTDDEERGLNAVLMGKGNIRMLPNGIARLETAGECVSSDPPDVLYLARLQARKRPVDFVEMADILVRQGVRARFSIVGPDEGQLTTVQDRVRQLGLADVVHYEGALPPDQVESRLRRAAVYVLPSVDEPFPMSLLEAIAVGVPAVCTTSCGIARTLQEWDAAAVAEPGPEQLARVVGPLLQEPRLRSVRVANGHQVIASEFSIGAVAAQLERDYEGAIAGTGRPGRG